MQNTTWRIVVAAAAAVTIACGAFALGAAMTSDSSREAAPPPAPTTTGSPDATTASPASVPVGSTAPGATAASAGAQSVAIAGFAFDPEALTVAVGSTITWTNDDDVTHNVFSTASDVLASPDLGQGDTYEVTLDAAGTIDYQCDIHEYMKGSITVTP